MNEKDNVVPSRSIEFKELSSDAKEFLHELNDPNLLKNREVPAAAKLQLKKHQVSRLRSTISVLEAKREEFTSKMSQYIGNLTRLVESLETNIEDDATVARTAPISAGSGETRVQCLHCNIERSFTPMNVIFARESETSLGEPTELYVLAGESVKKGYFVCCVCGTQSLVIKAHQQ